MKGLKVLQLDPQAALALSPRSICVKGQEMHLVPAASAFSTAREGSPDQPALCAFNKVGISRDGLNFIDDGVDLPGSFFEPHGTSLFLTILFTGNSMLISTLYLSGYFLDVISCACEVIRHFKELDRC